MSAAKASKRTREEAAPTTSKSSNNSLHIPWNQTYQHLFPASSSSSSGSTSSNAKVLVNPKVIPPREKARLEEELRETRYRDKVCEMCSDTSKSVRHHHFSSTAIKRMAMTDRISKTAMCPVCKSPEPVSIPATETRRVVMADSTLYGVWDKMPPSLLHFDIDSIVGGKVRDMTRALERNYLHLPNRYEVIVVAGINNIGAGETAAQIMEEILELKNVLKNHSEKWRHPTQSFAVICTVMYAPKFCSLSLPPPQKWLNGCPSQASETSSPRLRD